MSFLLGGVYVGEWKEDKKHGFGKLSYDNGEVYEGHWGCGGKMHGQGRKVDFSVLKLDFYTDKLDFL